MNNQKGFIESLKEKPEHVRRRIFFAVMAAVVLVALAAWALSLLRGDVGAAFGRMGDEFRASSVWRFLDRSVDEARTRN